MEIRALTSPRGDPARAARTTPSARWSAMTSTPLKVLLVAPDKSLLESLSKFFDLLGLVAIQVTDPRQAAAAAASERPDMLILDSELLASGRTRALSRRLRRRAAKSCLHAAVGSRAALARRHDRGSQAGRRRFPGQADRFWRAAVAAPFRRPRTGIRTARAEPISAPTRCSDCRTRTPSGRRCAAALAKPDRA